jgi:hypothetical protein
MTNFRNVGMAKCRNVGIKMTNFRNECRDGKLLERLKGMSFGVTKCQTLRPQE